MRKAALHNLGCKVNSYETEAMQQLLEAAGYQIVDFEEKADVYIINTCSVTNVADKKSRQMLHRAKAKNPEALVVAAGCYAQAAGEKLLDDTAIDLVIGNNKKAELVQLLEERLAGREPQDAVIDISAAQEYEALHIERQADHTRAFIKVQDGCNQFCSYCIIPYTRGRVRSRRPEDVEEEVRTLAEKGYQEIVLTGIHLSSYGTDFKEEPQDLLELTKRLHQIPGVKRIRFGSLEPRLITEEFVRELSAMEKICPHFHLSLQSGTSHYFGDKFSKAYDVTFTGRDNQLHHPFQTSWGVSTRLVGAIIMTHGDDDGLILPPAVAPIQVVVVPIAAHKPGVSEKAAELAEKISKYARVKLDDSDNAPGWKFSQWEMKGVPLRLEIGPKDLEKNQCVLVRRDTREKVFVSLDELETAIPAQLEALRKDLYERALANREKRTWAATTMDEVKELAKANTGYIKTMWCGDLACEMKMKEEAGLSSRCMPFAQEHISDVCPCCGKPAKAMVYWGVAY